MAGALEGDVFIGRKAQEFRGLLKIKYPWNMAFRGLPCDNPETQHINKIMVPNPDQPKDWITHGLHWHRMGRLIF
jgi:hypothetical protein